jgi:hypothetical protein
VYMVDMYCERIDERLRRLLGDQHAEWEKLPDMERIPKDLVL